MQMTYSLSSSGKTTFVLNLPVPSLTQSLVTLAVSADSVQFVSNTSPAKIQSTQVRKVFQGWSQRLAPGTEDVLHAS